MARWTVGERVQVYDGDVHRWITGTIEAVGVHGDAGLPAVVVQTEEFFDGLPLKMVVVTHPSGEDPRLRRIAAAGPDRATPAR